LYKHMRKKFFLFYWHYQWQTITMVNDDKVHYRILLPHLCLLFWLSRGGHAYSTEATSLDLDWKISNVRKSQCSATACWWEIEDILRYCVEDILRWGYIALRIAFETLEKQCCSYLRNIKTAINNFCKPFAHNLPIFFIGELWLNIGICQTLGFSIQKMSPQYKIDTAVSNSLKWNTMLWVCLFLC
jgi:hypothetical protein